MVAEEIEDTLHMFEMSTKAGAGYKDKDNKSKNTGKEKKEKSTDKEEPTLKVMAAALKEIEEADSDSSLFTSS